MRRFGFMVALALGLLLTEANATTYTLTDGNPDFGRAFALPGRRRRAQTTG